MLTISSTLSIKLVKFIEPEPGVGRARMTSPSGVCAVMMDLRMKPYFITAKAAALRVNMNTDSCITRNGTVIQYDNRPGPIFWYIST